MTKYSTASNDYAESGIAGGRGSAAESGTTACGSGIACAGGTTDGSRTTAAENGTIDGSAIPRRPALGVARLRAARLSMW